MPNKNMIIYTCFVTFEGEHFAFIAKNASSLEYLLSPEFFDVKKLNSKFNISIKYETSKIIPRTLRYKLDKDVYQGACLLFETLKTPEIRLSNVSNMDELDIAILAESKSSLNNSSDLEWLNFLISHDLNKAWLDGDLTCTIQNFYTESSREFGRREKTSTKNIILDSYDKVWDFPQIFNGKEKFVVGDYSNYWYESKDSLIKVSIFNKEIDINRNKHQTESP